LDLSKEGELLLVFRYLKTLLDTKLGLFKPEQLLFYVRQVPPAISVFVANPRSSSRKLVCRGVLLRPVIDVGRADESV
jgi:hypothetical protein